MRVILDGLETEQEWQCGHNAASHAERGVRNVLEYDTPAGELTLAVQWLDEGSIHVGKL